MRVRDIKRRFAENAELPSEWVGAIRPEVLRSWQRSLTAGHLPWCSPADGGPEPAAALAQAREAYRNFLAQARGIAHHLCEQIRGSGSALMIADSRGMVLECMGDADFMDFAGPTGRRPGVLWDESRRGTNAIGTALVEAGPVEVLGSEHFLDSNSFLASSAVPVNDPGGRLLGVVDIASHFRNHQRHAFGLAKMTAQMLERRLFEAEFGSQIVLGFHPEVENVGTLQEGLLAFSADGELRGADQTALRLLGLGRARLRGLHFDLIFERSFGKFIDGAGPGRHGLTALPRRFGGQVYAQLRGLAAPVVGQVRRPAPASDQPAAVAAAGERRAPFDALDTGDPQLAVAITRAKRVVGKDIPLLILGESGVGKEAFARAFHAAGKRRTADFVALNCAAIPENLIESELFGYVGGAFTGARREGYAGKMVQANGGTLFLDEIGDMPLNLQARLLRVLQERTVTPLGGAKSLAVDVSLVCATHRDLQAAVREGSFREDLYYRINGLSVTLPPLRRRQDLRQIVAGILRSETRDGDPVAVSAAVLELFERYPWPGNIRQMQNVLRVALALREEGEASIALEHLPEELVAGGGPEPCPGQGGAGPQAAPAGTTRLAQLEAQAIERVLAECNGNVSAAARKLGISRNTLYRKLGRL